MAEAEPKSLAVTEMETDAVGIEMATADAEVAAVVEAVTETRMQTGAVTEVAVATGDTGIADTEAAIEMRNVIKTTEDIEETAAVTVAGTGTGRIATGAAAVRAHASADMQSVNEAHDDKRLNYRYLYKLN